MKTKTKKSMERVVVVRLADRDFRLLHAAAATKEVSMSDVLRDAMRTRVKNILRKQEQEPRPAA